MTNMSSVSRRNVLKASGGVVALAASGGAALGATEFDAMRARIGQRLSVRARQGSALVVIEDVVRLGDPVRRPFRGVSRVPFAVVFRHEAGTPLAGGTHLFSSDGLEAEPIMVSAHAGADGVLRMEAVFN